MVSRFEFDVIQKLSVKSSEEMVDYILPKKCFSCNNRKFDLIQITEINLLFKCKNKKCGKLVSINYKKNNLEKMKTEIAETVFKIAEFDLRELLNSYCVNLREFKEDIIPKSCKYCKSEKIKFHGFTDEEGLWRCEECRNIIEIPYDFRDPNRKIRFYFHTKGVKK